MNVKLKIFSILKLININIILISLIILLIQNINCQAQITEKELTDFFNNMTIDRIRQIYWNIVCDLDKKVSSPLEDSLSKKYMENYLHSMTRETIIRSLFKSLNTLDEVYFYEYLNINDFKQLMADPEYDLFSEKNYKNLISIDMPRNFLVNFAINIDKYERRALKYIDGINDYINYMTKEKIVEYLNNKLKQYTELNKYKKFNEIVLNNIEFKYKDIDEYSKNISKDLIIQILYGFENYFFNILDNPEIIAYNYYQHDELYKREEKELSLLITIYNKEAKITNLDEFILKIENRYFNYTNIHEFFRNMEKEELNKNLLALEKYHKRQKNITKSLRGLIEYTEKMDKIYQIRTLTWGLSLYPELYQLGIFQDIISSEINLQYGQVKEFIQTTERDRDILLKYAYNIHTYQNKIESIYNENLYNLYRFKNDKLLELILSDTNLNRNLQVKDSFENFANLHNDDFCKYLENLERNQLKRIVIILIQLYFNEKQYEIDYYKRSSEELTRIELTMSLDNNDMLSEAIDFITTTSFEIQKTSDFFKKNQNLLETYVYKHFGYYNNIMDFLRSTNIYYLKLWLRKYELIIRRKKMYTNIKGGLENNFLNEYTKKDILEIFDVYLEEYPELFVPKEFIDIVGLNTDNTPHKKLVELFNDIDQHKQEIIMRIIYSLTGYYQRKNIQTSFNIEEFINEIKNNLFSNDTKIDKDYNNRYLFQLFRFINIFPELNNNKLFENLCIKNETRIINLYEDHSLGLYFRRDIVKIAKNVQYYLNYTKGYDKKIINEMNEEELKKYIIDFYDDSSLYDKNDLKSRIFDGDFYPIIYDYYENYLNNLDDEHFNFKF